MADPEAAVDKTAQSLRHYNAAQVSQNCMETLWLLWKAVYWSGFVEVQYIHVASLLLPLPQSQQTAGL